MKDLKYIIKRILIGVGIILVLSYIGKTKASALSWDDMTLVSSVHSNSQNIDFKVYYDYSSNRYYYYSSNMADNFSRYTENASNIPYVITFYSDTDSRFHCYLTSKPFYEYIENNVYNYSIKPRSSGTNYVELTFYPRASGNYVKGDVGGQLNPIESTDIYWIHFNNASSPIRSSNYDVLNFYTDELVFSSNISFLPGLTPYFVAFNQNKTTLDNIITGYNFNPQFSSFDTNNYNYQYKFGSQSTWTNLTQNNQIISTKNNTTLYIRIVKKSDSSIIDSSTFTINNIGQVDTNYNYDIIFTSTYINAENSINIIEEKLDIEFIPNSSNFRYQYKFFTENQNPNNINWTTSATNKISYSTNVNGTIIARITDSQYNELYSETFDVAIIGKLAINNGLSANNNNNFWTKISSKINYGGPVSSLFILPVKLLQTLYSPMYDSNTCTSLHIANLFNTSFDLQCVNFKNKLGNDLYNLIDLILAFSLVIGVFKFILKIYNNLISMKEGVD